MSNIHKWEFKIPLDDVRVEDYDENGSCRICVLCGKNLKNKTKYFVHLIDGGDNLVSTVNDYGDTDLGFLEVGAACKRKLPNNFYWTENKLK